MFAPTAIADELAGCVSSASVIRRDEPMARHTTLRVGGPADFYVEPAEERDLAAVLKFCQAHGVTFFVLGRGSNLLVRDGGFRGVVICLSQPEFSRIRLDGTRLHCGAGARLKQVAVEARRGGVSGLEFLEGIPGSLGGALRMNAGAMGGATFEVVESVRVMAYDGAVRELPAGELAVAYRACATLKTLVALGAVLRGQADSVESIAQRMSAYSQKRWRTQPAAPSAGCMFKNPATIPAGRLIDELGLKGSRVGGARVSQEHGNFLVNDGHATAADVLGLIDFLQARARAERGIELHPEVEIIGE
ncbi:MAG: UDP-N-acetylmuramate dehydrogenase [Verrucomicrobiae bacterium]|nr:UDP-N-acetylmuramate dehydrogenase [Verrucomicrobiae bacterium]